MSKILTAISAGGIVRKDGKILLVKVLSGKNRDMWMLPGGFVEPGESIERAAVREVLEETSIEVAIKNITAVRTGIRVWNGDEQTNIYIVFNMDYISGMPKPDGIETSDVNFFTIEEIINELNIVGLSKEIILDSHSNNFDNREIEFTVNNSYKEYNLYS